MQEKDLFEYAVLRVVPRVEREEFLNVGVVLFCAAQGFLQVKTTLNEERLKAFSAEDICDEVRLRLRAFEQICAGRKEGGAIGQFATASRFRWLTSTRSTVLQISAVHPGLCTNPAETLERLHAQLVL
ncbi:DUF3037 domain-containing protein [Rufibacter soli]